MIYPGTRALGSHVASSEFNVAQSQAVNRQDIVFRFRRENASQFRQKHAPPAFCLALQHALHVVAAFGVENGFHFASSKLQNHS